MKRVLNLLTASFLALLFTTGLQAQSSTPPVSQLFAFACDSTGRICPEGNQPNSLIQSADGNYYGTTLFGGSGNQAAGTVFKITSAGQLTTIYNFVADQNGKYPNGSFPTSLVEGNDGFLYGTAGVVFRLSKAGTLKVMPNVVGVATTLTLGRDGNLYGGTMNFGAVGGTLFRLTPSGSYTLLHTFNFTVEGPMSLGMTQASDGNFYGTTLGGEELFTTLFRLTPDRQFTTLQILHYALFPTSAPVQASNGKLYFGMTGSWLVDSKRSARNVLSTADNIQIQHFPIPGSGFHIIQGITEASDSNLWAIVNTDAATGEIVSLSPGGKVLQTFPIGQTNELPDAPLVQSSDGKFFGVTVTGGSVQQGEVGGGVVFTLDAGLAAPKAEIVTFNRSSGKVGTKVMIQGSHFVGSTAVAFNGVSAAFKVLNTGNILATVPQGATTGPIAVTNPGGTTTSKKYFTIQ